jgi:hypothetical protein
MRKMQKASVKRQVKNKPSKPKSKPKKIQSWRKKIDWSAAGRKAYETRMKNQGKHGKTVKVSPKKPQKKPAAQKQVKQHGKRKTVGAFGNYRVNRDALVAELKKSKKTEFAPTEIVSLTWNVIKKASAKQ